MDGKIDPDVFTFAHVRNGKITTPLPPPQGGEPSRLRSGGSEDRIAVRLPSPVRSLRSAI